MALQTDTRATARAEILQVDPISQDALAIPPIRYRTVEIDGAEIFYREAGAEHAPAIVLLHGFPTSSHMYRNLIPALVDQYRVIAPDYPGFGYGAPSDPESFDYGFDDYADLIESRSTGAASEHSPSMCLIMARPSAFASRLRQPAREARSSSRTATPMRRNRGLLGPHQGLLEHGGCRGARSASLVDHDQGHLWQYQNGVDDPTMLSPDAWTHDQALMD